MSLNTLFRPASVALVGASTDPKKYGYWTAKSMIDNGFAGELYMISRTRADNILGYPVFPSVLEVPGSIDLAIVAIAPAHIIGVIEQCAEKMVKNVTIVSTGFGETGEEGKAIERQILEIARNRDMRIMGPNCMGMFSSAVSLNASIIDLESGPLSLVLQSGNFGIDINFNAKSRGLGYSSWATIGNQMDLRFHDFVKYIRDDKNTKALMLYMEGLRVESEADGRNFLQEARQTSLQTPIAAIKIGRSNAGARAAASHTGSLAGSETIFDAALKQAGIVRVDSPSQLLDVAQAFAHCSPAKGNRVAILTDGGGHGVMATDLAEMYGLDAKVLSEETQEKLRKILMPHCPIKNPVDLAGTPEADMWVFDRCAEVLLDAPEVDGLIMVGLYGGYKDLSEEFRVLENVVARSLVSRIRASSKPVVMHSIYQTQRPESLQIIAEGGVPVFNSIDSAVHSMGALVSYERTKREIQKELSASIIELPVDRRERAQAIFDSVRHNNRINLVETEARDILKAYGFNLPEHYLANSPEEAAEYQKRMECSAVMKIVSPQILHKTDADGVLLKIDSPEKAILAFEQLKANAMQYNPDAEIFGVLVTPMLSPGVECIIGSTWDSTFGPTVMFGLGGIFVEVLKDVAFRVAPVNKVEAAKMLSEIKGAPILDGVRGAKGVDRHALTNAISRLSYMATELTDIAEIDINPVFAMENGLAVVDARIVLHPAKK